MKQFLLFLSFTLPFFNSFAQEKSNKPQNSEEQIFTYVERSPTFPGGQDSMMAHLERHLHYPEEALRSNQQGICYVSFVVDTLGKIKNARVIKSAAPSLDAEAIRVINNMPNWVPGIQNEKKVAVQFTLPIRFQLPKPSEKEDFEPIGDNLKVKGAIIEQPQFPGGIQGLTQYLSKHINYPEQAQREQIEGLVIISFIVNTDGSLTNHKIIKSLSYSTDQEALRVVKQMPLWKPGKKDGVAVRVRYKLPVRFTLTNQSK